MRRLTGLRDVQRGGRVLRPLVAVACVALSSFTAAQHEPAPGNAPQTLPISSDLQVRVLRGRQIELRVRAAAEDDYRALALRVTGGTEQATAISAWNADRPVTEGAWISVPVALLSDDYRALVLRSLFPGDHLEEQDWVHVVRSGELPTYDEGLWEVAEWFVGRGDAFPKLMSVNGLNSPELRPGQRIRIPADLLHPAFRAGVVSGAGELEYGTDGKGPYAGYRLKKGEALYSAVVGRFTGRTGADDVREVAELLRQRSGIRDLRDIPVGFKIKIPLDLLEPRFLPEGHPRRVADEAAREELNRALASRPVRETRRGLEGVLVIVDPGHGGRDLGTMNNGIWEHDYVYDVACRLKRNLEERSSARVRMTMEDKETGCSPSRSDKLKANRQGTILTTPPFLAQKSRSEVQLGVNLRWYLANSIYRKETQKGTDADRVVFLSLHADSRHPSLRGVMVYVPGAAYRAKTYGSNSKSYRRFAEVREKPLVHFSKKDRIRSEAVSSKFASSVVRAFREVGLPVQPYQPVRNRIIRGKSVWVPAVLRGNAVPNKVLVEMVNLSNAEDASLLSSAENRERLADALHRALLFHFGEKG